MNYFNSQKLILTLLEDIKEINTYIDKDHYIQENFQQMLTHGEYDDNSIDLSYRYTMLKEIEEDKEFITKLNFILEYIK